MDAECRFFFLVMWAFFFKFFFSSVCVKYSHFKTMYCATNLCDVCKSDNINVNDVCFSLFLLLIVDRIQDAAVQDNCPRSLTFNQRKKKLKTMGKKWNPLISRQMDSQRKMNVRGSFETKHFFLSSLSTEEPQYG